MNQSKLKSRLIIAAAIFGVIYWVITAVGFSLPQVLPDDPKPTLFLLWTAATLVFEVLLLVLWKENKGQKQIILTLPRVLSVLLRKRSRF